MALGKVKTIQQEKGFGFISGTDGEYFFHATKTVNFADLKTGVDVQFDLDENAVDKNGEKRTRAVNVRAVKS